MNKTKITQDNQMKTWLNRLNFLKKIKTKTKAFAKNEKDSCCYHLKVSIEFEYETLKFDSNF